MIHFYKGVKKINNIPLKFWVSETKIATTKKSNHGLDFFFFFLRSKVNGQHTQRYGIWKIMGGDPSKIWNLENNNKSMKDFKGQV